MNAFELAFSQAKTGTIDIDALEAKALGITVAVLHMFKNGFKETYETCKVDTLEAGHVLPVMKREATLKGMSY